MTFDASGILRLFRLSISKNGIRVLLLAALLLVSVVKLTLAMAAETAAQAALSDNVRVRVTVDGYVSEVTTGAQTVEEMLGQLEIARHPGSRIYPPLNTMVVPQMAVYVHNPLVWRIMVDGVVHTRFSFLKTVGEALAEADIELGELDRIEPVGDTPLRDGLTVTVVRVAEETVIEQQPIPFSKRSFNDDTLDSGKREIVQTGADGIREIEILRRYEDGEMVSEQKIDETILQPPVEEVVRVGTRVKVLSQSSGIASWYRAATMSAASRDFPRGTWLRVTNIANGRSVEVKVNDYGPQASTGRAIDLSSDAFSVLAPLRQGLIREVLIEELGR